MGEFLMKELYKTNISINIKEQKREIAPRVWFD
jgi:hypothetical protein